MVMEQEPFVLDDYRDINLLDLGQFPHAEDCAIEFEDETPTLVADSLGLRLRLPWWDRRDTWAALSQSPSG